MDMSSTPSRPLGSGQSRPWTARSGTTRPGTARPQTAASTRHEGSYVIALVESRGVAHEVGIAAMDRDTGRVMLVQVGLQLDLSHRSFIVFLKLADCPTYVKTLHQMHIHYPSLVLVPDTFIAATDATLASAGKKPATTSLLVQFIMEEFPNIPVEPVARKYWNDGAGVSLARR